MEDVDPEPVACLRGVSKVTSLYCNHDSNSHMPDEMCLDSSQRFA